MHIRRIKIERFRGIRHLRFSPGPATVILGPNNSGKSAILEALDLLLHPGRGRPRPAPEEADYFDRDPSNGFEIEAVLGNLSDTFRAEVHQHLEGWRAGDSEIVPEPDGDGVEPVVRVRVRGTEELELLHELAKPESEGARFHPALRERVRWVFDGRSRDPSRQLSFYQGGLLDRLFAEVDLTSAIAALRSALGSGADAVNRDTAVDPELKDLSADLERLGLLEPGEAAAFELGAVSRRALLQTLRLTLPAGVNAAVPLARQGRGVQRLVLLAVLLRLAEATGGAPIGGFEEPEEALEPLRQVQLAEMLHGIVRRGGQVFLTTHSPGIARCFGVEDFLLLRERAAGDGAVHLSGKLSPPVRQTYERRLDGPVVRGLFSRIPVLVEGPSDRGVFEVFWSKLAEAERVLPAFSVGMDVINCEGARNMPMIAAVLKAAGKAVVAWVELDTSDVEETVRRLRDEGNCAAILLHDSATGRQNLERALAWGCSLQSLSRAMTAVADDRTYSWEDQRYALLSACGAIDPETRARAKAAGSVPAFLQQLDEPAARQLVAVAFGAKSVAPFELKGTRPARIAAEAVVESEGVPGNFAQAFEKLYAWIQDGCTPGTEIQMITGA